MWRSIHHGNLLPYLKNTDSVSKNNHIEKVKINLSSQSTLIGLSKMALSLLLSYSTTTPDSRAAAAMMDKIPTTNIDNIFRLQYQVLCS
jgi:hypothetical protein